MVIYGAPEAPTEQQRGTSGGPETAVAEACPVSLGVLDGDCVLRELGHDASMPARRRMRVSVTSLHQRRAEILPDGLSRLAPRGVDIAIDARGGPFTGQAVGGPASGGRAVVLGYAAAAETTMRVTDLVWKLAHVSGFSLFAASAGEQAPACAAVLPLPAARSRPPTTGPSRSSRPPGATPSDPGPAVRQGDPDYGRLIRQLIPVL